MKVTKIQQQQKRPDRYSIYIDDKYQFSLNDFQLATSGLRLGKELGLQEVENFRDESTFGKAYERALNYVMIRPRSTQEIHNYLKRSFLYPKPKMFTDKMGERRIIKKEVDKAKTEQLIERVMDRLNEKGYINDESFTKAWVHSRQLTKHFSKRKLEQELRVKGIPSEIIATTLQNENITDKENLAELVSKKRSLTKYQDDTKLMQYLARQGFNYDDIKDVLNNGHNE
jgi:regulatory protein